MEVVKDSFARTLSWLEMLHTALPFSSHIHVIYLHNI